MPLLRTFDSRNEPIETIARKVRALSRFDVLEAEASPAGAVVRDVVARVRSRGDAALCEYTKRFDKADLTAEQLRVPADRLEQAAKSLDSDLKQAIRKAIDNVRAYQEQILDTTGWTCERPGIRLELRIRPLRRVGVYVPAGSAPLPSTAPPAAMSAVSFKNSLLVGMIYLPLRDAGPAGVIPARGRAFF